MAVNASCLVRPREEKDCTPRGIKQFFKSLESDIRVVRERERWGERDWMVGG